MFSPEGYRALTEGAGLVRRADRGVLAVTGGDRLTWLQGLVTNDVLALPVGRVCDAAYLTPQGRMITDLRVANLPDRVLLDVPAPLASALQSRLDALLFSEDAQVADVSADVQIVEVHGPRAGRVVEGSAAIRDDVYALPGFVLFVDAPRVEELVSALRSRGAEETTLETLDVLRVEAGRPAYLVDMDEHTIPLEAGLEQRAISFTKGCYVGQEVIVRVLHRGGGRVARKLVGFRFAKADLPKSGDLVRAAGRDIGTLTSVVRSPALGAPAALGYVHRDFVGPGTTVEVVSGGQIVPAVVAALPLVDRAVG